MLSQAFSNCFSVGDGIESLADFRGPKGDLGQSQNSEKWYTAALHLNFGNPCDFRFVALDGILSEQGGPVIRQVDLKLQNRELRTKEDVQALVAEIEQRLLQQIEDGAQIRLI